MADTHYIIRGGVDGRERLRRLARVLQPSTRALLARAGIDAGMACLDAGCGGGDVTLELARLVGTDGSVVGTDIDEEKLALARGEAASQRIANVEYRRANIVDQEAAYDLAYSRFLLSHLPDPQGALAKFHRALRPLGTVVVEDVDFSGHFCFPDCAAFRRYVDLYTQAARRRGVDANIGPRLPQLLSAGGFESVHVSVVQPVALDGDTKLLTALTMENIADSVAAEGLASQEEISSLIDEMYAFAHDPTTLMSFPRIVQVWGRRTAASEPTREADLPPGATRVQ